MGPWSKAKVFFSQVRTEMTKVTWPSKEDLQNYTIVVITATIVVGVLMAAWDQLINQALSVVFQLGG